MSMQTLAASTRIGISKFTHAFLIVFSILVGLTAPASISHAHGLHRRLGIGLGFGLQAIASNFVSGFVLLMDRSIKPGDVISFTGMGGTTTEGFGWVQELQGRYVVVRDRDGVETLVPNQNLITNSVINWSYTDPKVRLKLPVRISYRDDPELALRVLIKAAEGHRRILREPAPVSRMMAFTDHGMDMELRFWIADPQEGVNNVRSDVNRAIWRLFKENGITIPVAQREVYVRARRRGRGGLGFSGPRSPRTNHGGVRGLRTARTWVWPSANPDLKSLIRSRTAFRTGFGAGRTERQQGRLGGAVALRSRRHAGTERGSESPPARLAGQRLNDDGSVLLIARRHRTQEQNRRDANERLADLIRRALVEPKLRHATRPTRASRERRLESKRTRKSVKRLRGRVGFDE